MPARRTCNPIKKMGFSDADMMGRGSKTGSGKLSSESQANVERRERLRKLAMETVDLNKDPYFLRNHLGDNFYLLSRIHDS